VIAQVTGRVLGRGGEGVVLEVGGVGLEVVATRGAEAAARPGTTVTLQTHLHVREDALQLFGFADVGERRLFRLLLGVSGVGPRLALAVVSAYPPDQLARAIVSADVALLSSVSGVGKRTAERICLDLRERIAKLPAAPRTARGPGAAATPGPDLEDPFYAAREALVALGFGVAEAESALDGSDGPAEDRVRTAFAHLSAAGRS
jgi:Holliday junction DNA helicase RuvA